MTDAQLFSSCSKENCKKTEDINENISIAIPNKQRSCAAVNTPAACVNKAINQIQDLEVKLEESFLQHEILYNLGKLPWDLDAKTVKETEEICLSFSTEVKAKQSLRWKDIQSLKQKTSAVVAEVIELISRLENERKDAEEALEFEKQHRKKLYLNSDKLSFWRLQQLPKAVQEEWEKCLQDIIELQWHFEEKNEQLQDALNQLTKIEGANSVIVKQINFMKKYSPLLEEKLCHEDDSMKEVKILFEEAKAQYDTVHQKYLEVQKLHEETKEECEIKRLYMREQIEADETTLNQLRDELKETDMLYTDINNKIHRLREEILENENRLEELIKQEADIEADLNSWRDKERRLKLKISRQESENRQLLDEFLKNVKTVESSKSNKESDLQKLKDKLAHDLQQFTNLQDEIQYLKNENAGFMYKFRDSAKRKMGYQSEIQVLQKNIRRLEEHLKKVNKDLYAAELAYDDAKTKLDELNEGIGKEKSRFKNLEENIKKQIRDEISAWKLTQKRLKALQAELERKKKEHEKLVEKMKSKLKKYELLSAEQAEILEKNKDVHKELMEKIAELNQKIKELDDDEETVNNELENKKKCAQNLLDDKKEKYLGISSQFTKVNEEIAHLQKEIAKLSALRKGQESQIDSVEKSVVMLREKYTKIKSKEENTQRLVDFLYARLDAVRKKIKTGNIIFDELLWKRQNDLKIKKISLNDVLDENLRLAREYQMLQICYLNDKNQLMDFYDHKSRAEAALRDQQQLSQLQKKLHKLLVEYFKLQALYNQAKLGKLQAASHETVQKILAVKEGLSETVQNTNTFLKSLTDGSST
ncbi:coiled-coil domain-containing protein 178 isoform X1 [Pantherophis guttatus]|uniref:Coiled-coil domain-containing protein 178 isoform X1 n=1 Tax=Pantherophis guttatus TaxID=94885 RepID=A0A6P9CR43_PANGU|nr:coiled-coil domain-containing protein 178 isoform X1 [Pantherophis guttatus]XP_034285583.1 coiled-coil domain-containing protein 178 isoform X1 [Pantherophis guttatus]XP_034285584.1 coiled-coil domain-containing protein 178 isoform X1 [Pantherophis guttatus]XP_034285585.1 coiled-coil domain-containing protein 178 isoform X1 [Pantherophis guttatus]XP_034285586.1 coiled-coil domain-containing protein 178 isoform X1 [Pantherophis guttatus]XP_034285587.1 coiled-coil domain-containing protein 17